MFIAYIHKKILAAISLSYLFASLVYGPPSYGSSLPAIADTPSTAMRLVGPLGTALSIDGGGARGSFPAQVLRDIEHKTGKPISALFKGGLTGTSTGSFIALALAMPCEADLKHFRSMDNKEEAIKWLHKNGRPAVTAERIGKIYDEAPNLFKCWTPHNCIDSACSWPSSICGKVTHMLWNLATLCGCFGCCKNCGGMCGPKYSNKYLRDRLEEILGDTTIGEAIVPVQVVAYDISQHTPIYFSSWDSYTENLKMVDVALASSAAPTYFPAVQFEGMGRKYNCVDGGLIDNNPSFAAYTQARHCLKKYHPDYSARDKDFRIISIGTGTKVKHSDFAALRRASCCMWAAPAIDISMNGTSQSTDILMRRYFSTRDGISGVHYARIQTVLGPSESKMDDPRIVDILRGRAARSDVRELVEQLIAQLTVSLIDPRQISAFTRRFRSVVESTEAETKPTPPGYILPRQ